MTAPARSVSALARAAVKYAEHGWHVFPLLPRGKHPLLKNGGGFTAATCSAEIVADWWHANPDANIGLWPGQSQLVVIDLDGPDGQANAQTLGLLSQPTLECRTGRADGGRHLYFKRPNFPISNAAIGKKIDVRCDAGYVILPPSVHPSGRRYEWLGRVEDIQELPPAVVELLRRAQAVGGENAGVGGERSSARGVVFEDTISEGGRNNALTRYAGRLLAKGVPEDETLILVSSINQAKCKPALPQHEINAMVAGLAQREAKKRVTSGGTTISLVDESVDVADPPSFATLASQQVAKARALLTRDVSRAPRWAWRDVDGLAGAMLPGDLLVVGSLMGNGKSTLLMSQMDAFAQLKMPVLYVPLEIDPEVNRLRWAAWRLQLDVRAVIRQEWSRLPEGAREHVECVLDDQERNPFIHFAPPKRITVDSLLAWCQSAREEFGCRVVMLDHLHRMEFGGDASNHRVSVTEVVRRLKDMARDLELVLIAAAQLNRANDPVDAYTAPLLGRLKESAGIAEEADVVLMLSRRLRKDLPKNWANELKLGRLTESDLAEPGVMVVTCRKHRLDGDSMNHSAYLSVDNGRLRNRLRPGEMPERYDA